MISSNFKFLIVSISLSLIASIVPYSGTCDEEGSHVERYKEGVELFRNSRFLEASRAFREAYEMKPSWKLWFNIAQSEASAKRYGRAVAAFELYLVEGGDEVPEGRREVVLQELKRLRPIVGVIEVDPKIPHGAEVFIDDETWGTVPLEDPIRVGAQKHLVTVKMGEEVLVERRLTVPGQGSVTIFLRSGPGDAPDDAGPVDTEERLDVANSASESVDHSDMSSKSKLLLWSGVGSGVVGLGLVGMGIGFNAKYSSDLDSHDALPANSKKRNEYEDDILPRDKGLAIGGYVAGGVFVAAGVALIVVSLVGDDEQSSEPLVTAAPGGLSVRF